MSDSGSSSSRSSMDANYVVVEATSKEGNDETKSKIKFGPLPSSKKWIPPTSIEAIEARVKMLLEDVPSLNDTQLVSMDNEEHLEQWAHRIYQINFAFSLLMNFVEPVLYKWDADHTGNSSQNVSYIFTATANAENLLGNAIYGCKSAIRHYQATEKLCIQKITTDETIYDDDDNNAKQKETVENEENIPSAPSRKKKQKVERQVYKDMISSPTTLIMNREIVAFGALDKRELVIAALSMTIKALEDYRKASANDVDSRNSGMMM